MRTRDALVRLYRHEPGRVRWLIAAAVAWVGLVIGVVLGLVGLISSKWNSNGKVDRFSRLSVAGFGLTFGCVLVMGACIQMSRRVVRRGRAGGDGT